MFFNKMKHCDGSGECLTQVDNCNQYELNPEYSCEYRCKPIPCDNTIICNSILPPWFLGLKRVGVCLCMSCESTFHKKLTIVENTECPICMDIKTGVTLLNCSHSICVDCFKRCMYGEDISPVPFPYPIEVEDEYYDNGGQDDPEFIKKYPLVKKYERDCKKQDIKKSIKYQQEENLRMCPYCRK
jgi:hypothetical protein